MKFPRNNRHYQWGLVVAKFKLLATFSSAAVAMLLCPPERKHSSVCCCTLHDFGLCTGAPQLRRTGVVAVSWRRSRETSPESGDTLVRSSNGIIITFGDGNRVKKNRHIILKIPCYNNIIIMTYIISVRFGLRVRE